MKIFNLIIAFVIFITNVENIFSQCANEIKIESVKYYVPNNPNVNNLPPFSEEVEMFKCQNGYTPPKGYEWMSPTKIYMRYFKVDNTNIIDWYNPRMCRGDNLSEVNKTYSQEIDYDNQNFATNRPNTKILCLDCGLGYFATVLLYDEFVTNRFSRPNQGFGYTCGQPTPEIALKIAYESARKALNKPAKYFNFKIGINAKFDKSTSNSGIQTCYKSGGQSYINIDDYNRHSTDYGNIIPPDNSSEFLIFIKNLSNLNVGYNGETDFYCQLYTKNYNVNITGITDDNFPIFTESINDKKAVNKLATSKATQEKKIPTKVATEYTVTPVQENKTQGTIYTVTPLKENKTQSSNLKKSSALNIDDANEIILSKFLSAKNAADKLELLFNQLGYKTTNKDHTGGVQNYYISFSEDLFISINPNNDKTNDILICGNKLKLTKQLIEIKNYIDVNYKEKCMKIK